MQKINIKIQAKAQNKYRRDKQVTMTWQKMSFTMDKRKKIEYNQRACISLTEMFHKIESVKLTIECISEKKMKLMIEHKWVWV